MFEQNDLREWGESCLNQRLLSLIIAIIDHDDRQGKGLKLT